jgi:Amidohydrolase family
VTLLNQYTGCQEYGRARERDARGPEHHAEEDDQIPVVVDQGIDTFHGRRSIRITAAPERLSELAPEKSHSPIPQFTEGSRWAFRSGHLAEKWLFSVHAVVSVVLLWALVGILRNGLYTSIDGGEGFVWAADRRSGSWYSGMLYHSGAMASADHEAGSRQACLSVAPQAIRMHRIPGTCPSTAISGGCCAPRPQTVGADHRGETVSFDILIKGALVFTGDGPALRADVGVADGRISAVEPRLPTQTAGEVLDAAGLMLCPGFIDMHAHTALESFRDPRLEPKVAQGFTTELINPDGLAPAPVSEDRLDARRDYLRALEGPGPERWTWSTFAEYLDALADTRPAITLVPSIGHNAVRDFVIGGANRQPDREDPG